MPETTPKDRRDYASIEKRLLTLKAPYLDCRQLGRASDLPIYGVSLKKISAPKSHPAKPTVLLNGGTHGDEPASPEAVLAFLENGIEPWLDHFDFEVIACLNPYGYIHNTRENEAGIDLNWGYEDKTLPEIAVVRRLVHQRHFALVFDCHEDWESPGFYFYEVRRNGPLLGNQVIKRVETVCPINRDNEIEGTQANNGVITPDPEVVARARGAGLPITLFRDHTDHFLTSESPTGLDMEIRVKAQLTALEVVLEQHAGG
jgi:murein peptide amidase A